MIELTPAYSNKTIYAWLRGLRLAVPIMLGYLPIGFAYGVLAQNAGLSDWNTMLMSILVYAGSSQLIAVGLFVSGAPVLSVILTTFIVNLRHTLMSASISPHLKSWRKFELALFSFELTDETFAFHSNRFALGKPEKLETFGINLSAQLAWVLGTAIGLLAGKMISDIKPFGLDFALPAMFAALVVMQIKTRIHIGITLCAGIVSIIFLQYGITQWNVIAATLISATIGVILEHWTRHQ